MIPQVQDDLRSDFEMKTLPSKSFYLTRPGDTVAGYVDNLEAMAQVVYLILSVERYEYLIHGWNYGVELNDLYGKPIPYCIPEIKRRVTEALLQDERITSVDDFEFETVKKGVIHATFQVTTIFGVLPAEKEVNI